MSSNSKTTINELLHSLDFSDVEIQKFLKILSVVNDEEIDPGQDTSRKIEKIVIGEE